MNESQEPHFKKDPFPYIEHKRDIRWGLTKAGYLLPSEANANFSSEKL